MTISGDGVEAESAELSPRPRITHLFTPMSCLHGTHFPIHVRWTHVTGLEVRVVMPRGFRLVRLNNAKSFHRLGDSAFVVTAFEQAGSLGIVSKAPLIPAPTLDAKIRVELVLSSETVASDSRKLHLFRPEIEQVEVPPFMNAVMAGHPSKSSVDARIRVSNSGEGIALIVLQSREDSDLKITEPKAGKEFRKQFWTDLVEHLKRSRAIPPGAEKPLQEFRKVAISPPRFSEASRRSLRRINDRLGHYLESNSGFARAFSEAAALAYMNNIDLLVDVSAVLDYLRSVEASKIVLLNVQDVLHARRGAHKLRADLFALDLALQRVATFPISLRVRAGASAEVPVYEIVRPLKNLSELGKGGPSKAERWRRSRTLSVGV